MQRATTPSPESGIRLAEIVGALSLASDFGLGQPFEHALQSSIVAMRLGEQLGMSDSEMRTLYYASLLRSVGCTASAHETAAALGDEIAFGARFSSVNFPPARDTFGVVLQHVWSAPSLAERAAGLARLAAAMPRMDPKERISAHCEVAQNLASRLGLDIDVQAALSQVFERWDGHCMPRGLKGEAILQPVRVMQVAEDAAGAFHLGGRDAALAVIRQHAGKGLDPMLVDRFEGHADLLLADLDSLSPWDAIMKCEPRPWLSLNGDHVDEAFAAVADFADLKSPFTVGHSRGVGRLAAAAAERCRIDAGEQVSLGWAAYLHDLGRTGVPNTVWDKPGPLTVGEWERVRLHPYYTERILSRSAELAALGGVASLHHERLDGSGYHRGFAGAALSPAARILAASDAYHAMTEDRPHRPAISPEAAADELRKGVTAGRFDGDVANAVLAAAGHRVTARSRVQPAGLSEREVEVLRLLARGLSNREMAQHLSISKATVGHHIQHIYDKLGISTRAAATMFALQHGLVVDRLTPAG
jgi:HD-GYP domain-containing protein (c-di-GMP phosphodiesterase class II)